MSAKRIAAANTLSTGLGHRRPRTQSPKHLAFIRTLPCLISGRTDGVEAAHIRYGNPCCGKRATGMGEKPSDMFVVPLHHDLHRTGPDAQHQGNERKFWEKHNIDPCFVALALWAFSGDSETAEIIIRETRRRAVRV